MFAKTLATLGDRGSFGVCIQGCGFSIETREESGFGKQTREKWGENGEKWGKIGGKWGENGGGGSGENGGICCMAQCGLSEQCINLLGLHGCVLPIVH